MEVQWLIDTGCTVTIISTSKFQDIPVEDRPKLEKYEKTLVAANDQALTVHGQAVFNIKFGTQWVRHKTLVADVSNEGLIGLDFLTKHKVTLDFSTKTVTCSGEEVEAQCRQTVERACRVSVREGVMIRAGTRAVIEGRSAKPLATGAWLVEPLRRENKGHSVLVARAMIQGTGSRLPLEVMNPGLEDVYLYPRTQLGIVTRVQDTRVENEPEETSHDKKNLPVELQKLIDQIDVPLNEKQEKQVEGLLTRNKDVFALPGEPMGRTDLVQHEIRVETDTPIKQHVRRPPLHLREAAEQEVQRMLKDDVVEPSESPWSSPVVLVRKKDGSLRYCIDYRKLNAVTVKDSYPLPRIDDSLDALRHAKYFTTLDMASGYWQIGLSEDAKQKSAFCTTSGLYQFKVMPFGLTNAPATFQRLMERVLAGLQWQVCLIYIDDVIIFSRTVEGHIQQLQAVFDRLKAAGLKLKPKKCHLFRRRVQYLGHVVSEEGISTDPEKLEAIRNWERPTTVSQVRSFLGLCSYYRRFVPEFATLARPLIKLTEKTTPFTWTDEQEKSWIVLKEKLMSPPVLDYPDPEKTFILDTDASDVGIGAVLSQETDGHERVIAYGSRVLTKPERRYCVTRRELLAVVHFVKTFRHYLIGKKFILRSDHASLRWLRSFKEPEGQVARWLETLDSYDFELVHRPGRKHVNADALSRGPCPQCEGNHEGDKIRRGRRPKNEVPDQGAAVQTRSRVSKPEVLPTWFNSDELSLERIKEEQDKDPTLSSVREWMSKGNRPRFDRISCEGREMKFYWGQFANLQEQNGVLVRRLERDQLGPKLQILVPRALRPTVLTECHEARTAGHLGRTKTIANVRRKFLWPGMRKDADIHVRTCEICSKYKITGRTRKAKLSSFQVGEPMERLCIDIAGPYPETSSGNKYCLVITDWFTKFVEIHSMPNQEAETVAEVVARQYISRYGVPREIHTDQGTQFESQLFKSLCVLLGIHKTRTTSFRPQSDGQSERNIKTLIKMMAIATEQRKDWDECLPYIGMAYRATPQESTGFSPNFLMFGRELAMPVDIMIPLPEDSNEDQAQYAAKLRERLEYAYELARNTLRRTVERQKRLYNERVFGTPIQRGDIVWVALKTKRKGVSLKLQPKWKGPSLVIEKLNEVIAKVQLTPRKIVNLHVDMLKPCELRHVPQCIRRLRKKIQPEPRSVPHSCAKNK